MTKATILFADNEPSFLKRVILFADNEPDFVDVRSEFLQDAGYRIVKAYTLEQARQRLAEEYVHLAILDIRMVDDDDENDTSGLTLAKDPKFRLVPKIILTGYPTVQAVREALGPVAEGLPPAVEFLAKVDGPEAMILAVDQALATYVPLNSDLQFQWDVQQRLSFIYLVTLLRPQLSNDTLAQRAGELEDLFRRLLSEYRQVRVSRLFWHGDGQICLWVLACSAQGATDARVVVCGEREALNQELALVQELAPDSLQTLRMDCTAETMRFAAVSYALPDADLSAMQPLRALFQDGKERPLKTAFGHLLTQVLPAWHQHGQTVEAHDLMALYRRWLGLEEESLPRQEVEQRVDALVRNVRTLGRVGIERGGGSIHFRFPGVPTMAFPDPVAMAYGSLERVGSEVLCAISPGRLSAENILVDGALQTWLTGFGHAGLRPQWWDFVWLEAMIRFDLSQAPDLPAWLEFEECLAQASYLDDRLQAQDVVSDLKTSVVLIEQIRHQANLEAWSDLGPYEAGLLVWTVAAMARHDPALLYTHAERMRGASLLLSAAFLAQRLTQPPSPAEGASATAGPLRLDPDGVRVWRGDQRVPNLGDQELKLFRCLVEHDGQVVSREVLVRRAFDEEYVANDKYQEGRLNALVLRLRSKIEPAPANPRYLLTSRGKGYSLKTGGE